MGYMLAMGPCLGCRKVFSFNPVRVPSCSVVTGKREPICQACVDRLNLIRVENGLQPIVPLPRAYEPGAEDEL
jgi:hypothetical protein